VQQTIRVRRFGGGLTASYFVLALIIWALCAIVPNAVGLREFGFDAWVGMATVWSGMFIWPIFFLPLIMLALYRPFQILLEATLNSDRLRDALTYASPIIFGTVFCDTHDRL